MAVWILDLDGVVWLAEDVIPGVPEAVARLREGGHTIVFPTNNSSRKVGDLVQKFEGMGIDVEADEIVTSAQAAASMLEPGSTALVCAGDGVREALDARGVKWVNEGEADTVVVGFHKEFDYGRLNAAYQAVRAGARLVGTNDDVTYPTPDGPIPGGGSLLAAVAAAAGVEAEVAGKPYQPMADAILDRLGGGVEAGGLVVGDRPDTDGLLAKRLGLPFALVFSGVTKEDDLPVDPEPVKTAPDLPTLVDQELA
ncbi:MAG TPA: HAD-IIA family hydrolase [Acidimicrobiales bacterium]|nr:HAD-IIA family hydrolase [Acidimicrobiales bacterium]